MNPQVGDEIPGEEEGAQMMQLTQPQLAQRVNSAVSQALIQNIQQTANNPPLVGAVSTAAVCVCVFSSHSFWTLSSLDVPAGVTQGEGHRIFHPPSFCGACLIFSREKELAIPFPRQP